MIANFTAAWHLTDMMMWDEPNAELRRQNRCISDPTKSVGIIDTRKVAMELESTNEFANDKSSA